MEFVSNWSRKNEKIEDFDPTKEESYEIEFYKRAKNDIYLNEYLDSFQKKRSDDMIQSVSKFPLTIQSFVI